MNPFLQIYSRRDRFRFSSPSTPRFPLLNNDSFGGEPLIGNSVHYLFEYLYQIAIIGNGQLLHTTTWVNLKNILPSGSS